MYRKAREDGAAAVEFALILPILLLLIGGVIDFGHLYYNQIILSNAARDGARLVTSNPTSNPGWTMVQIQDRIKAASDPLTVTPSSTSWTCTSGNSVTVTVTRTTATAFQWTVLGILPALPTPVPTGKATVTCS